MRFKLSKSEFERRRAEITRRMEERGLDALCVFSPTQVFYMTGFAFIATERPICAVYAPRENAVILFVPLLEVEHAEEAFAEVVRTYEEYPGGKHPMNRLAQILCELGIASGRIGVDSDGYGGGFGYAGPRLSDVIEGSVVAAKDLIHRLMQVKSEEEIELIRHACLWAGEAHRLLHEYTKVGLVETDVSFRASHDASMRMLAALGPEYRSMRYNTFPAQADYRGQIGSRSAIPHSITVNATFREGDVLVTGAAAEVGGYLSELERTMILGSPTDEQQRLFDQMMMVREVALRKIRPGVTCSAVDGEVRRAYKDLGVEEFWRHHTGHAIGYGMHEAPFLDVGDETIIEEGMIFTVEPGLYVLGVGGFRHSDTVLVTEDGVEMLTAYPQDLQHLIVSAD